MNRITADAIRNMWFRNMGPFETASSKKYNEYIQCCDIKELCYFLIIYTHSRGSFVLVPQPVLHLGYISNKSSFL